MVKLMRWPSWPPASSKKFEIQILLRRLEGLGNMAVKKREGFLVEVEWKGQKGSPSIRSAETNSTIEAHLSSDGSSVEWNEEFRSFCNLSLARDGSSDPWQILFTVIQKGPRDRELIGSASLNLSEYASAADASQIPIKLPLKFSGVPSLSTPSLCLSLSMVELRTAQKLSKAAPRSIVPVPRSPPPSVRLSKKKDEFSLKEGLKRVKIFRNCVSGGSPEEGYSKNEGVAPGQTDQTSRDHQFDIDFPNDSTEEGSEGRMEFSNSIHPFNYETLASANLSRQASLSNRMICDKDEQWTYYGKVEHSVGLFPDHLMQQNSNRRILSWRKLSFKKSAKNKGEPLLNKNGEEGGDDIDYCRRQLSSFKGPNFWESKCMFGDDSFSVGSWEEKKVTSRDAHLELQTKIFFASIDQRNERAAGESACTALVVVIADWLQSNRNLMPTQSELDNLIREGSSEWRNLCKNEDYIERFPDKHFDIDTILQTKIRPLDVVPDKSFVGFFDFEALDDGGCDFFQGAMSFDSIWDEIARLALDDDLCNGDPLIYIVSWNDHFFILKVENDAYYIIDTLGERLFEGCNEAYILKFDKDTTIKKLSNLSEASNEKAEESSSGSDGVGKAEISAVEEEIVCRGKESCKEYIKSFMAAIPIREAEADVKKGVLESTFIHRRLQIEFHHTLLTKPMEDNLFQPAHENRLNSDL